ncbi:MAG: thermonuclease family protein [Candidatus Kapaibacteriales bacterium]
MKKFLLIQISIITLIVILSCQRENIVTQSEDEPTEAILISNVVGISDGDTFSIFYKNQKWKVRVLYVDCFETQKNERLTEQARKARISIDSALSLGLKAKEFAKQTLLDKKVELRRDFSQPNLDYYGRLLRITIINGERYDSLLRVNNLVVP